MALLTPALVIAGAIAVRLDRFSITTVRVDGAQAVNAADVHSLIERDLIGDRYLLVPRRSMFFFPRAEIERDVLAKFPRIKTVVLTASFTPTLTASITERSPQYVWCASGIAPCQFLDAEGVLLGEAPIFSGAVYLEFDGGSAVDGRFLSLEKITAVSSFVSLLKRSQIEVVRAIVAGADEYHLVTKEGWQIYFRTAQSPQTLVENLEAAVGAPEFIAKKKQALLLQYIDVRFENKIYYKFSSP